MNQSPHARVVVVDDDPLFAESLALTLMLDGRIEVVAVATNGHAAVDACRRLRPDVALVDLHMPGIDGLETTRALRLTVPGVRVLMLTSDDGAEAAEAAMRAGVWRFLVKSLTLDAVRNAIADAVARPSIAGAPAARLPRLAARAA